MRKKSIVLAVVAIVLIGIGIGAYLYTGIYVGQQISFEIVYDDTKLKVRLYENKDEAYIFLPSGCSIEDVTMNGASNYKILIDGDEIQQKEICSVLKENKKYELCVENMFGMTIMHKFLQIYVADNVATLDIQLKNSNVDKLNQNKDDKIFATAKVISKSGEVDFSGEDVIIHGRGNSSWQEAKKPYTLELTEESEILGMNSSDKWVLVANACDESNLRDRIVYDFANNMELSYSPQCRYVNLYMNEQYYGLYLLVNKIQVGKHGVDVSDLFRETQMVNSEKISNKKLTTWSSNGVSMKSSSDVDNPLNISGGYLVESTMEDRIWRYNAAFITKKNNPFVVDAPKYCSQEQMEYVASIFQAIEDNLQNPKIEDYIDLDSWAEYYLIQEMFANTETASYYYYKEKDNDKVYAGPVWDFDLALGTCFSGGFISPKVRYASRERWYSELYNNDVFLKKVKDLYRKKYKEKYQTIIDNGIEAYEDEIKSSFVMNKLRWKNDTPFQWCSHFDTIEEYSNEIKKFMSERIKFLDEIWVYDKNKYCAFIYSSEPLSTRNYYEIEDGKIVGELPTLFAEGYSFLGWYNTETGKEYDEKQKISSDVAYVAKWEELER